MTQSPTEQDERMGKDKDQYRVKNVLAFCSAQVSDVISYQGFTFLIFTFYYAVIGLDVGWITIGFIIWSVWNSLNDPLLGYISDRTHTKWGRRIPYFALGLIPLSIIMVLLWTPPVYLFDPVANFIYFIIIIMVFEGIYTMFSLAHTSMFPEIFLTEKARIKANSIKQMFSVLGLIVAFILPTLMISDLSDPAALGQYQVVGLILGLITFLGGFIFLKWGPKERPEFDHDYQKAPRLLTSIKWCVKSRSFRNYIPAELANWYVFGMLPTIVPLYGKFVLGIGKGETIWLGLLLGVTFISAAIFINLWKRVVARIGARKAWMCSFSVWILTLLPTLFITDRYQGLIVFFLIGIGLSGSMVIIDLLVADIIDEDEIATGIRRESSYYGVNALFLRTATIFVFLSISLVFSSVGWKVFEPEVVTDDTIFGLRALMFLFPAVALAIGILAMYRYPLDGAKLQQVKADLEKIHASKREQSLHFERA